MTDEEIQEMHDRMAPARKRRAERLAKRQQEAAEANARFDALSPIQKFLAVCEAECSRLEAERRLPAIDPEADIDRPGQEEWKQPEGDGI